MSTRTDELILTGGAARVQLTYREAVAAALHDEMASDPAVILMGEDVANDGGVFKTNGGLAQAFGVERVINTPICENGFLGVAVGMAVTGLRPVVEIMFSDFLPTAGDALVNEVPKMRFMSGGQCRMPLTIRAIGGATGRFGTQHSATGESWYMQVAGLRIAAASSAGSVYGLLRAAIRSDDPVLLFEHKMLYGRKGPVTRGAAGVARLGAAETVKRGRDVTVVATLMMVERALRAAELLAPEGIDLEVIDLRWIRPLDLAAVRDSVRQTGRLLVAEEQYHAGGWGATLVSLLAMERTPWKSPPMAVSLPDDMPIPFSPPLEDAVVPSAESVAAAARRLVREG